MSSTEELLEAVVAIGQDQLRWQRAAALPQVRESVDRALVTVQQRRAYELLDGTRAGKDVCNAIPVPKGTLSGWTRKWRNLGIAFENDERHIQHLISLAALDLEVEPAR